MRYAGTQGVIGHLSGAPHAGPARSWQPRRELKAPTRAGAWRTAAGPTAGDLSPPPFPHPQRCHGRSVGAKCGHAKRTWPASSACIAMHLERSFMFRMCAWP